ncbi:MAG: 3-oxoacyl-ACP reductase family protein [Anaerolineae bacterium]
MPATRAILIPSVYHICPPLTTNPVPFRRRRLRCHASSGQSGGLGVEALAIQVDVANRHSVQCMVEAAMERFGCVDILVNNAGICPLRSFEEISEEEWDRVLDVNLKGAFLCSQAVIKILRCNGWGRIINIASVAGKMGGVRVGVHYAASKGGMIALTLCLARQYAPYGITVNAIAPATVATGMIKDWPEEAKHKLVASIPLGRLGQPEDVAAAVVFLASDGASFITGEVLDVNGGFLMD